MLETDMFNVSMNPIFAYNNNKVIKKKIKVKIILMMISTSTQITHNGDSSVVRAPD